MEQSASLDGGSRHTADPGPQGFGKAIVVRNVSAPNDEADVANWKMLASHRRELIQIIGHSVLQSRRRSWRHGSVRTRLFITIWLDQLVQNVMHIVPKNLGHVLERQLSYDLGKKVVRETGCRLI